MFLCSFSVYRVWIQTIVTLNGRLLPEIHLSLLLLLNDYAFLPFWTFARYETIFYHTCASLLECIFYILLKCPPKGPNFPYRDPYLAICLVWDCLHSSSSLCFTAWMSIFCIEYSFESPSTSNNETPCNCESWYIPCNNPFYTVPPSNNPFLGLLKSSFFWDFYFGQTTAHTDV